MTTVVVGGGLSGLLAARRMAASGEPVTLLEADRLGGSIRSADLGGIAIDMGAEAYAVTRPEGQKLVDELGLPSVAPATGNPHLVLDDVTAPIPPDSLLGIPSDLSTCDAFLTTAEMAEAARRDSAPVVPAQAVEDLSLGDLVRARLGDALLARLVDPVVRGVHAVSADHLDADAVAPGLRSALARLGSLRAAVRALRGEHGQSGTPVRSIPGGMSALVDALVAQCRSGGVQIRERTPALSVARTSSGGWRVQSTEVVCDADHLVLAIPSSAAAQLLCKDAALAEHLLHAVLGDVCVVALRVHAPALDVRPLGSGALIDAGRIRAKGFTHASAKWEWIGRLLEPHEHIVRLSYGRDGEDPAHVLGSDPVGTACADMESITGGPVTVHAAAVQQWPQSLSHPTPGLARWRERLGAALAAPERSGLMIIGPGVSGNGITGAVARVAAM